MNKKMLTSKFFLVFSAVAIAFGIYCWFAGDTFTWNCMVGLSLISFYLGFSEYLDEMKEKKKELESNA